MNVDVLDPFYQQKLSVITVLNQVIDPELGINVIDLGLIYDIKIQENPKEIIISMTLSTPSCPVGGIIKTNVELAIKELFLDHAVVVLLVFEPRWSLEMVTETGKAALGW
jgi:metal-sulfur cluster biosynthetic enzyme